MREGMHAVVQEISVTRGTRLAGLASLNEQVSAIREATRSHIQALNTGRNELSGSIHGDLATGRAELAAGARDFLRGLSERRRKLKRALRQQLAAVATGRRSEVRELLRGLASTRDEVARELHHRLSGIRRYLAEGAARRRSDVDAWLKDVSGDRAVARREWDRMASTLAQERAGIAAPVAPVPAGSPGDVEEGLPDRVFAYLADHPDGVPLVQVEREFGLARFRASRLVKSLIEDGKATKQDRLYFAT